VKDKRYISGSTCETNRLTVFLTFSFFKLNHDGTMQLAGYM